MNDQSQNDEQLIASVPSVRFTIGLLLIVMTVIAALGMSLGYYAKALRSIWDESTSTEIGVFAIVAAMTPTVFLVIASWFLKATSWFLKIIKTSPNG